jgi:hypothetical protein
MAQLSGGIMLKFENASNGRFYYMTVQKDMTGADVLVVVRGGRDMRVSRTYGFDSPQARDQKFKEIVQRRIRNGYSLVS